MHTLLEAYLDQVAAHLSALPAKRRKEELREMRQHLQNAVTVNRELGQSEEDAAANAVLQFGTPEDLGSSLVWAWRREEKLNKRSFWGAATCTFVLLFLAALLQDPFVKAGYDLVGPAHPLIMQHFLLAFDFFGSLVAGLMTRSFFSKRLVTGSAFGIVAYSALCICVYAYWLVQPGHLHQLGPVSSSEIALRFLVPLIIKGLVSLGAAWISSLAQRAWHKRKRMVWA